MSRMNGKARIVRSQILRSAQESIESERTIAILQNEPTVPGLSAAVDILQAYLDREAEREKTGEEPNTLVDPGAVPDSLRGDLSNLLTLRQEAVRESVAKKERTDAPAITALLADPAWVRIRELLAD